MMLPIKPTCGYCANTGRRRVYDIAGRLLWVERCFHDGRPPNPRYPIKQATKKKPAALKVQQVV